ncbi:MAG: hypothetical protein KME25_24920 [Symplocastrum torsivum CPER-KK1]|uniref:Uncharacterized protein n=1 Tax=Symplocastrum torsivum CPER-KK1 TaxID=450513 RepID=A0A951PQ09_9CYAN|nr:hypothetical protein [Symplocastrum torsivum CPER-KK1]
MVAVVIYPSANLVNAPNSRIYRLNEDVLRVVVVDYTLDVIAITANYFGRLTP